jgi:hypothetical protein
MPLVGSRVYCDSLRTEFLAINGGQYYVGDNATTRISQCGDFIYIYTQSGHILLFLKRS